MFTVHCESKIFALLITMTMKIIFIQWKCSSFVKKEVIIFTAVKFLWSWSFLIRTVYSYQDSYFPCIIHSLKCLSKQSYMIPKTSHGYSWHDVFNITPGSGFNFDRWIFFFLYFPGLEEEKDAILAVFAEWVMMRKERDDLIKIDWSINKRVLINWFDGNVQRD